MFLIRKIKSKVQLNALKFMNNSQFKKLKGFLLKIIHILKLMLYLLSYKYICFPLSAKKFAKKIKQ